MGTVLSFWGTKELPNINISILIIGKCEIVNVKCERIFFLQLKPRLFFFGWEELKPKLDEDPFKVPRLEYSTLVSGESFKSLHSF